MHACVTVGNGIFTPSLPRALSHSLARSLAHILSLPPSLPPSLYAQYSRHVVKALVRVVKAGNGIFMPSPPLTLDGKPYKKFYVTRPQTAVSRGALSPVGGAERKDSQAEILKVLSIVP